MTTYYADFDLASGLNDGTSWANAWQTANAITGLSAGDVVYVSHDSQDSTALAVTITGPVSGEPCLIITVDKDASDVYTKATAANIQTTGGSADINIEESLRFYGLYFDSGDRIFVTGGANESVTFENCTIESDDLLDSIGASNANVLFKNCTITRGANSTSAFFQLGSEPIIRFEYCTFTADTPSSYTVSAFVFEDTNRNGDITILGGDMSTLTSLTQVVDYSGTQNHIVEIDGLKPPSGVSIFNQDVSSSPFSVAQATRYSDSYSLEDDISRGKTESSTTNVRDSGASDGTAYAFKVTSDTTCTANNPIFTPWMKVWCDTTGSVTVDCFINSDDTHTDTEVWLETEYMDADGVGNLDTTRESDILSAGTALDSDTSTWTTDNNRYKLSDTVSVGTKGWIRARVGVAVDITDNLYVCPKLELS